MITEIDLNGARYQIGKLSAMQQFHVSRRIAPVLPPLIMAYFDIQASELLTPQNLAQLATSIEPVLEAFARMKDDETEYVIGVCMRVVERYHGSGWARVWSSTQDICMFDDIDMGVMLNLTGRVIIENLGPFIQGLLTDPVSSPTEPTPAG